MAARRLKSLMHGSSKGKDGVVWHREHRSKKGRWPKERWFNHKIRRAREEYEDRKSRKFGLS